MPKHSVPSANMQYNCFAHAELSLKRPCFVLADMTYASSLTQAVCRCGDAALTNQQNKKKNTCNGGGKRCPPEVIVADEDHVDGHIRHSCDEGHDGRTPHIVLHLHGLQRSRMTVYQCVMHVTHAGPFHPPGPGLNATGHPRGERAGQAFSAE